MASTRNRQLLPAYLVVGTDQARKKAVLDRLNVRLAELGDMSLNSQKFDGTTATGSEIVSACSTMPFMSEKRSVIVAHANKLKKEDVDYLVDYLKNPSNSTVLLLVADKLAKNTRLYKAVEKINKTCIISCQQPKKYQLAGEVNRYAQSKGASIAPNAAQQLINLIGEDTLHLNAEVDKILLATGKNRITLQDVTAFTARTTSAKPWDFTNAFAQRNLDLALRVFATMPEGSEYSLLPMTLNRVKELICVQDMGPSATQFSVAKRLGLQDWQVKNHISWSRNFKHDELIKILALGLDTEKQMKSTTESSLAFEMFTIESLRK